MPAFSMWLGTIFVLFGFVGYIGAGLETFLALVPAFIGLPLAGLGFVALGDSSIRPRAMQAGLLVAGLGLLGTFGGVRDALLNNGPSRHPLVTAFQVLVAVLCVAYLIAGARVMLSRGADEWPPS